MRFTDRFEGRVSRRLRRGDDQPSREDIERFVLHRAAKVRDSDNIEEVEVILEAEFILVPLHAALEARHRELTAVDVCVLSINPCRNA